MTKAEVLELRDEIFKEWDYDAICASSGMPSGPSKTNEWYIKMTELAERIENNEEV